MMKRFKLITALLILVLAACVLCGCEVSLDTHTHSYEVEVVEPTCDQQGYSIYTCSCGTSYTSSVVEPLGHDYVVMEGKDATCTETGLTLGAYCKRCDTVITEQEVIPALGHDCVTLEAVAPTCLETGLTEGSYCKRCDTVIVEQEEVPLGDHNFNGGVICEVCQFNRTTLYGMSYATDLSLVDGVAYLTISGNMTDQLNLTNFAGYQVLVSWWGTSETTGTVATVDENGGFVLKVDLTKEFTINTKMYAHVTLKDTEGAVVWGGNDTNLKVSDAEGQMPTLPKQFGDVKNGYLLTLKDTESTYGAYVYAVGEPSWDGLVGYYTQDKVYYQDGAYLDVVNGKPTYIVTGKYQYVTEEEMQQVKFYFDLQANAIIQGNNWNRYVENSGVLTAKDGEWSYSVDISSLVCGAYTTHFSDYQRNDNGSMVAGDLKLPEGFVSLDSVSYQGKIYYLENSVGSTEGEHFWGCVGLYVVPSYTLQAIAMSPQDGAVVLYGTLKEGTVAEDIDGLTWLFDGQDTKDWKYNNLTGTAYYDYENGTFKVLFNVADWAVNTYVLHIYNNTTNLYLPFAEGFSEGQKFEIGDKYYSLIANFNGWMINAVVVSDVTLLNGDEGRAVSNPDRWIEWHDKNWCGSIVTIVDKEVTDNVVKLEYTSTGFCWFGTQLFYKYSTNVAGKSYKYTLTINSSVACNITVNGVVFSLVEGDNQIVVEREELAGNASISIQLGKYEDEMLTAGTIIIKQFNCEENVDKGNMTFGENGYTWNWALGNVTQNPGNWFYWNDQNWNNSNVNVSYANYADDVVTVKYNVLSGANKEGLQLFYDYATNVAGQKYKVTMTVTSAINATVKLNGIEFNLVAGQATLIAVVFEEPEVAQYVGASIAFAVNANNGDDNTLTISNVTMTETTEDLTTNTPEEGGDQGGETATISEFELMAQYGPDDNICYHLMFNRGDLALATMTATKTVNETTTDIEADKITFIDITTPTPHIHFMHNGVSKLVAITFNMCFYDADGVLIATGTYTFTPAPVDDTPFEPITLNATYLEWYGGVNGEYLKLKVAITDDNQEALATVKDRFSYIKVNGEFRFDAGVKGQFFMVGVNEYYEMHVPMKTAVKGETYTITLYDASDNLLATLVFTLPEDAVNASQN